MSEETKIETQTVVTQDGTITFPKNRVITGATIPQFNMFASSQDEINKFAKPFRKDLSLSSQSRGFVIHNFLTKEECEFYIGESNKNGYRTIEKEFPEEYRNNTRYFGKNEKLSEILFQRMQPFFVNEDLENVKPYGFDQQGIWVPLGLDDCYTFGRYEPGGKFKPHFDATYAENSDKRSIYTIQVYLNDDYEGGRTNFYKLENPLDISKHELVESVQPRVGTALIFNHDTLHEGAEVTSGVKYIFRVDMMFIRVDKNSDINETQKTELEKARKLFFDADNAEKDSKDLKLAIQLYVDAQMMLLKYRSMPFIKPKQFPKGNLSQLPEMLVFQILKYSSLKDVRTFLCLNKHFNEMCKKNQLWKMLYIKHYTYEAFLLEDKSELNAKEKYGVTSKSRESSNTTTNVFKYIKKKMGGLSLSNKNPVSKNWYLTFQSIHAVLQNKYVVLDFGSEYIKFCDFNGSFKHIPHKASKHQEYSPHYMMSSFDREYWLIGYSATASFQTAVTDGELNAEKVIPLHEMIKQILSNHFQPRKKIQTPLLFAVSPLMYSSSASNRIALAKIRQSLTYDFIYFMNSALLALQSHGLTSGTVVMMGAGHTLIVSILYGEQLEKIVGFEVTGNKLKAYIQDKLSLYGNDKELAKIVPISYEQWYKKVSVPADYAKQLGPYNDPKAVIRYSPEIYFQPQLLNSKSNLGIVQQTHVFIQSHKNTSANNNNKSETRQVSNEEYELLQNVVVTGGLSEIPFFIERFSRELKELDSNLNIIYSNDRINDVLKGGLVCGTLTESYHDNYQTQQQPRK